MSSGGDAADVLAAVADVSPAWLQAEAIKESRREYVTSGIQDNTQSSGGGRR